MVIHLNNFGIRMGVDFLFLQINLDPCSKFLFYSSLAFSNLSDDPAHLARVLRRLTVIPATDVWPFADTLINHFSTMLGDSVPRYIQGNSTHTIPVVLLFRMLFSYYVVF